MAKYELEKKESKDKVRIKRRLLIKRNILRLEVMIRSKFIK